MKQGEIIGLKLKELRRKNKLTLKQLSEKIDLSISFLSQVERGRVTLGISALEKLADIFDVDITFFFSQDETRGGNLIVHSYEREFMQVSSDYIQYTLSHHLKNKSMVPQIYEIFPTRGATEPEQAGQEKDTVIFFHNHEEYIYILEGVLDMYINGIHYVLQPGDCAHIPSNTEHRWVNNTGKIVKLISISYDLPE